MAIEIIAEIAQGYEGNPKLAHLLAQGAVASGADAVKYQLVFAEELCTRDYPYYGLFKSLEMDESAWADVSNFIHKKKKKLYFDIYGDKSFDLARRLNAEGVKISAADFYNEPLIKSAVASFERVFISIAGVPINELDDLARDLKGSAHVTFMYGFQAEPTPVEENNLLRITELKRRYPHVSFGFMDHSLGSSDEAFYLPLMAAALGVSCIEKHITLDYLLKIEDYISALEPARFEKFVGIIRKMEAALGKPDLLLTPKEKEYKAKAGKVVVARRDICAGKVLSADDLTLKRVSLDGPPGSFRKISDVAGKKMKRPALSDASITKEMV